jgi:hypothetical protein
VGEPAGPAGTLPDAIGRRLCPLSLATVPERDRRNAASSLFGAGDAGRGYLRGTPNLTEFADVGTEPTADHWWQANYGHGIDHGGSCGSG